MALVHAPRALVEWQVTHLEKIILGLQLIVQHEPGATIQAEHDLVYAGTLDGSWASMSAETRARMEAIGWIADKQYNCWKNFV